MTLRPGENQGLGRLILPMQIVQAFMVLLIYHEHSFYKQTKCNYTVFLISVEVIGLDCHEIFLQVPTIDVWAETIKHFFKSL